jgi:Na+-transporting NADH:ubiquinone oxidoreductase subunit C
MFLPRYLITTLLNFIEKGTYAVSESTPNTVPSNLRTILFMVILSFACALILSILASVLEQPKETAKELDRSKQMMIAAKLLDHQGHFLVDENNQFVPAKYQDGSLVAGSPKDVATNQQLLEIYNKRIQPYVVNKAGEVKTFQEAGVNYDQYVSEYKKSGYYKQPWMLVYKILPNKSSSTNEIDGYVIPVNGFGLWDAIYGYLAIKPDGNTVIGTSWYDQKETPGLGANIAEAYWQNLFPDKHIFQESPSGKTDYKTAPLGIVVVKGKVSEVLGNSPKSKSAVDGMAGATLTGNGVTEAYRDVLAPYRNFLIKLQEKTATKK